MSRAGSGRRECRGAVPARLSARGGSRERRAGSQSRCTGTRSTNHANVSTNYSRRRSIIQKPSRSTPPAAALASIGACSGADHRMGTHARTHARSIAYVSWAVRDVACCMLPAIHARSGAGPSNGGVQPRPMLRARSAPTHTPKHYPTGLLAGLCTLSSLGGP